MTFFDSHTHVQFAAFAGDYKEVIDRALKASVGMINVGTQAYTSRRAVEVAHEFENEPIFAAVGLHPIHTEKSYHDEQELGTFITASIGNSTFSNSRELENKGMGGFVSRGEEFNYDYYVKLARDPKVVAIGECGLDYYRVEQIADSKSQIEKQKKAFLAQIELAHEVKKPLMIHCRSGMPERTSPGGAGRDAFADLIEILKANSSKLKASSPGVIHFFSGTKEDAKKLLDLGFAFTFGGVVTFTNDYNEVIKMLPLEAILSETDAPYVLPAPYRNMARERGRENGSFPVAEKRAQVSVLKPLGFKEERSDDAPYVAPVPHRGKRNEPAYVVEIVKKLAELKQVSVDEMAGQIFDNAKRVFTINLTDL